MNDFYIISSFFYLDSLFKFLESVHVLFDFWFILNNFVILLILQVTPAGYAQMTHLLNIVSGGKLLVILEGGSVARFLILVACAQSRLNGFLTATC